VTSQVTATLPTIAPENLAEFKRLATQAVELAKGEAGTIQYDWFLSDDETDCIVQAKYQSSDAQLSHTANMGVMGREDRWARGWHPDLGVRRSVA
jgi:quinol monooxygenase YgiN